MNINEIRALIRKLVLQEVGGMSRFASAMADKSNPSKKQPEPTYDRAAKTREPEVQQKQAQQQQVGTNLIQNVANDITTMLNSMTSVTDADRKKHRQTIIDILKMFNSQKGAEVEKLLNKKGT